MIGYQSKAITRLLIVCASVFALALDLASLALMEEKLEPAYVLPEEFTGSFGGEPVIDTDANFVLNLDDNSPGAINTVCHPVRDLPNSTWFWSVQVLGAFQPRTSTDADGYDGEGDAILGVSTDDHCVIFLEVCEDLWLLFGANLYERSVVVHEVGHTFQCIHEDGGIMGDPVSGDDFTPTSIDRIRDADKPRD